MSLWNSVSCTVKAVCWNGMLCWKLKMSEWSFKTAYVILSTLWDRSSAYELTSKLRHPDFSFWNWILLKSSDWIRCCAFISHDSMAVGKCWVERPVSGQWASVSVVPVDPHDFTVAGCPAWAIVAVCTLEWGLIVQWTLWLPVTPSEMEKKGIGMGLAFYSIISSYGWKRLMMGTPAPAPSPSPYVWVSGSPSFSLLTVHSVSVFMFIQREPSCSEPS